MTHETATLTDNEKDILVEAICETMERYRKAKDWPKTLAIAAAGARLAIVWAEEAEAEADAEQAWERAVPAFPDCAVPSACECARRLKPEWKHSRCLVPAINKHADALGWQRPYPDAVDGP